MTARRASAFHPELRWLAAVLPRGGGRAPSSASRRFDRFLLERSRKGVDIEATGAASVRLHQPSRSTGETAALLWIHGGGLIGGFAAMDDSFCRTVARELDITVAAVEYRRAPEHRFPAALDDCYEALLWLANRDDVDSSRIAIGGASAGGGLAAALVLLAHERGEITPAFQLLSYPMLDDRTVLRTDIDERDFRLWNNAKNAYGWASYLGVPAGSVGVSAFAAPARAESLAGLPDAWIGVGTLDLFYDEDVEYARRLAAAGVSCDLHVVDGAFHGFDAIFPWSRVARAYREEQVAVLGDALLGQRTVRKKPRTSSTKSSGSSNAAK